MCKNFEVHRTSYVFTKPSKNHKNCCKSLLKQFFKNLKLRNVGPDETYHMLQSYWQTQKYRKLDTKKRKS